MAPAFYPSTREEEADRLTTQQDLVSTKQKNKDRSGNTTQRKHITPPTKSDTNKTKGSDQIV